MTDSYQVVARRFRPVEFGEVVGQEGILKSLRSSLESGRIPHAFLFSGSRGVGKTTTARILARALNCEKGPTAEPCGECTPCTSILAGKNADVVEIDAASHNLVDDIRQLRDSVGFASMGSRYKVYILDEVHMLTRSAFNAFLKTLEEPPAKVVFILATTELHKVPETIRSRCQVLLFGRVSEGDIQLRLADIAGREGLTLPTEVLADIAASCRGGMRDAESALERILPVATEMGDSFDLETYRQLAYRVGRGEAIAVVQALIEGQAGPALHFVRELTGRGFDEREALGDVLELLRAALLLTVDGADSDLVELSGEERKSLQAVAAQTDTHRLDAMIQAGLHGRERLRRMEDRRLVLETALIRMARAGELASLGELVEAVRSGALSGGGGVAAAAAPAPGMPSAPSASAPPGSLHRRLVQKLEEEKPLMARTVEQCEMKGPDDGGTVHLALKSTRRLHRDRLASDEVKHLLQRMLTELHGSPVSLAVALDAGAAPPEPPKKAAAPQGGGDTKPKAKKGGARRQPGGGVKRAAERFDGQIVDLNDEHLT